MVAVSVKGREGLPSKDAMLAAREWGWQDAMHGRPRAAEHDSYLNKSRHDQTLSMAYNRGYIVGTQQALQDRYGDPPA